MSKADEAAELFLQGYNCSQALLATFGPELGLERETALRLAGPFGGGIGRTGGVCGALTGAIMAIGLKYSSGEVDAEAKERSYDAVRRLFEQFRVRTGSTACRDLLGFDIGTSSGWAEAQRRDTHHTVCPAFVRAAAEVLERVLA
jgi:C_GCAxxG_C_C family probable redox protein